MCVLFAQSCLILCDPMDCRPTTEVACHSFSRGSSWSRNQTQFSCISGRFLTDWATRVTKIPWRKEWQATSVFLPGGFHGQRSLVGYSRWGRKSWTWLRQFNILIRHIYHLGNSSTGWISVATFYSACSKETRLSSYYISNSIQLNLEILFFYNTFNKIWKKKAYSKFMIYYRIFF